MEDEAPIIPEYFSESVTSDAWNKENGRIVWMRNFMNNLILIAAFVRSIEVYDENSYHRPLLIAH